MRAYQLLALMTFVPLSCTPPDEDVSAAEHEAQNSVLYLGQPRDGSSSVPPNAVPRVVFDADYFFEESGDDIFIIDKIINNIELKKDGFDVGFEVDFFVDGRDHTIFLLPDNELTEGFYEVSAINPLTNKSYKWSFYVGSYPYIRGVISSLYRTGATNEFRIIFSEKIALINPGDICIDDKCNSNSCERCDDAIIELPTFMIDDNPRKLSISKNLTSVNGTKLQRSEARVFPDYAQLIDNAEHYELEVSKKNDNCPDSLLYCWGI